MAIKEKIQESIDQLRESLNQAVWYQEAKSKWEELEPQHQFYVKLGLITSGLLVIVMFFVSNLLSVSNLKQEYADKLELTETLRQANDELRVLNAKTAAIGGTGAEKPNWSALIGTLATNAGISPDSLKIAETGRPKGNTPLQEILYKVDLTKINIKQAVRLAYMLEHDAHPIKLRGVTIDTTGGEGYLNASIAVSVFQGAKEGK